MKVCVCGAGAWGTALAKLLTENGAEVTLWAHSPEPLEDIQRTGMNNLYLPNVELPPIRTEPDLAKATQGQEMLVVAVPSRGFREVAKSLPRGPVVVSVTKGIEFESGRTMARVLSDYTEQRLIAVLSGPTLAPEVARGIPSAIVAASSNEETVSVVQRAFHRPTFRVYTASDVLGVELGGALKNVIAIAAGVCDGLGFGDNSKAALLTRAIAEMRRFGVACGANGETFAGLSGLGDLTVTCFSRLSRNRGLGERLGRGERIDMILSSTHAVAEGYPTARAAHQLVMSHRIDAPILEQVYQMLYEGKDVAEAVRDLIARGSKAEFDNRDGTPA